MGRHVARRSRPRGGARRAAPARRRAPLKTLLVAATLLGAGSTGTYAYWSDEATVEGTTISSGTLALEVDGQEAVTATAKLDLTAAVPGNSTAAVFSVQNVGTAPLRYRLDGAATNPDDKGLGSALQVRVTDGTVSGTAPAQTCGGTEITAVTGFGPSLVTAEPARTLAAGAAQTLCVEATLPLTAPTLLQGATTDVTLTFVGTSF